MELPLSAAAPAGAVAEVGSRDRLWALPLHERGRFTAPPHLAGRHTGSDGA